MKLRVSILIPLAVVGILFGLQYLGKIINLTITSNDIYAAESAYLIAIDAGVTYRHLCLGTATTVPVLPTSCKSTLTKIISADKTAGTLYESVKGKETNVSASIASAFISSVATLKSLIPGG